MKRVVEAEILDELDAKDPRAIRSRRDLRLVNWFMRGESWILSELQKIDGLKRVVELGAGDGILAAEITEELPNVEVVCIDLIDRPRGLNQRVKWWQGDVLDYDGYGDDTVVIANLFLHHLSSSELKDLGVMMHQARGVLAAEPHRGALSMMMSRCLFPFVNDVTQHDMTVSIRAGFRNNEVAGLIGGKWQWSQHRGVFGGIRTMGVK